MAPELLAGGKASIRSDIYSLGVVLYQLLAGDFALPVTTDWAKSIEDPLLKEDLEQCFAGKLEERFASVANLAAGLRNLAERHKRLAEQQVEKVMREKAAYRRGLFRAAAAATLVVVAFALLALYAFKQARESKAALNTMSIKSAEMAIKMDDDWQTALAYLARVLRMDPANRVAAERIVSVLSQRDIALPLMPPPPLQQNRMVTYMQFSLNGQRFVTLEIFFERTITAQVWDARTGQPITEPLKYENPLDSVQISPDGQWVVTTSYDAKAQVWDARTGQQVTNPLKHNSYVGSVKFSPDSLRVVTVSGDRTARIWDIRKGQQVTEPLKHEGQVKSAQFSPDGLRVVTTENKTALVWDAQTGQPLTEPIKHNSDVVSAQISPDGQRVVTKSADNTARIWDLRTGQPLTEPLKHKSYLDIPHFSPDGLLVVTASYDKTARIWDARTGQQVTEPLKHERDLTSAQFSPDGQRVATMSGIDARIWDARTGQPVIAPILQNTWVLSAQFSPDGLRLMTAGQTAQAWDIRKGQPVIVTIRHNAEVFSAQFSPDGARVVTVLGDRTVRIWDMRTGQQATEPLKHEGDVKSAQFSPDGQRVVTASFDKTARVWDARTGQPLTTPIRHNEEVYSAQFSPDGQRVVTASGDNIVRVWDARTGQSMADLLKAEGNVSSVQYSPDGQRVMTLLGSNPTQIWDARTGQKITKLLKHNLYVNSAQFSPDGLRVVTALSDKTIRIWDARTGQPLTEPFKHEEKVNSACFSPDGLRVVTASVDKTARVWDARTGQPLTEPLKHEGEVKSAQFSPDGQRVMTASMDKMVRIWELPFYSPPAPSLLADLAEVVAGRRFNGPLLIEPVALNEYFKLKKRIENDPSTNPYIVWAKWFFADRATRTISPQSSLTIPNWIERRLPLGNDSDRKELESAFSIHPLTISGLAYYLVSMPTNDIIRASLLAKTALAAEPGIGDQDLKSRIRYWLSRYALAVGKTNEARQHIQVAMSLIESPARYWFQLADLELACNNIPAWLTNMNKACDLAKGEKTRNDEHPETSHPLSLWEKQIGLFQQSNEQKANQQTNQNEEILEFIPIKNAPLDKVIGTLLELSHVNATIDPRLLLGRDGKPLSQPLVSFRFKKVTGKQVLTSLLMNHNYEMIPITLARSLITKRRFPLPKEQFIDAAAQWEKPLLSDEFLPEISFNQAPWPKAIEMLCDIAGINFLIDPQLLFDSNGKSIEQPLISMKLDKVTAKQAIAKVLKTHDCILTVNTNTGVARIMKNLMN